MARILVIDDDPQVCDVLKRYLQPEGHHVDTALRGNQGLEIFRSSPADVVICDIVMPEKDGFQTMIELQRLSPDARIIAISGNMNEDVLKLAREFGALVSMAKPLKRKDIIEAVRDALGDRSIKRIMQMTEFNRRLIDSFRDVLLVVDDNYQVIRTNQALLKHIGVPSEMIGADAYIQVLGQKCHVLLFNRELPCDQCGDFCPMKETSEAVRSAKAPPLKSAAPGAERIIRSGDSYYEVVMYPLIKMEGGANYYIEIVRDVTERKRAEQEKNALQAQLMRSQKMEAIGTLASSIAHEINNPIGIIMGFAEYILDKMPAESPYRHNVSLIHAESTRIKEIVEKMLNFARPGDYKAREPLKLHDVVSETLTLMSYKLSKKKVRVVLSVPKELPRIEGNANALKQVMVNLLLNALEAAPTGGSIEIKAWPETMPAAPEAGGTERPGVVMEVADNGAGIPEDELEKIFEPFFTTKLEGTGLGLAIVANIVQEHRGTIEVESKPGQGTKFRIHLPARPDE